MFALAADALPGLPSVMATLRTTALPNYYVRRNRQPLVQLPPDAVPIEDMVGTEAWGEKQRRLQADAVAKHIETIKRQREERLAQAKSTTRTTSELLDNVREEQPIPQLPKAIGLPARGPRNVHGAYTDGEVPVIKQPKAKRKTRRQPTYA